MSVKWANNEKYWTDLPFVKVCALAKIDLFIYFCRVFINVYIWTQPVPKLIHFATRTWNVFFFCLFVRNVNINQGSATYAYVLNVPCFTPKFHLIYFLLSIYPIYFLSIFFSSWLSPSSLCPSCRATWSLSSSLVWPLAFVSITLLKLSFVLQGESSGRIGPNESLGHAGVRPERSAAAAGPSEGLRRQKWVVFYISR